MALSRIWSAFILIAILVATSKLFFADGNTGIYSKMVVGKQGDTSNTQFIDSISMPKEAVMAIAANGTYKSGEIKFSK